MICNSFWSVFLNSLQEKALLPACALKDILRNVCCCVGYEGNSLKTSVILRTEHVKRKTVGWRMINYELPHSSNSVRFAFNNFPVQKNRMMKACKKGNYPCGNEEEFPCENNCKSSRRIHENSLLENC